MMIIIIDKFLLLLISLSLSFISCDPIHLKDLIIREHTPIGYLLLTFNSTVNQRYSYRFVGNNHREIQRYFSLNSSTGELRIAIDIDRELICINRHSQCQFSLKIFELYHEILYYLSIIIEDINDHRPLFPYNTTNLVLHISENSPTYQSKLYIQQAYDQDQIDNQKQLKYNLKSSENRFPFILEMNHDLSNRLTLVLVETLDRELIDSYNCTLYVTDTSNHTEQLHIKIIIDDVNDQTPIFQSQQYSIELSELTPLNTTILQVHAKDNDIGLNGQIVYDFTDASKQFENIFSIDHETGVIKLRSPIDYEQRTSYIFYVEAHDLGKEIRSSQTLINITIMDENDCYPKIDIRFLPDINYNSTNEFIEISENYSIDKFFIQISLSDQDSHFNEQIHFSIEINPNDNSFYFYQINNLTYLLNRTKKFDYEDQQMYDIKFYAEDYHPKTILQTKKRLQLNIIDENDNRPEFLNPIYHLSIDENNKLNTILTKIQAFDRDSGENARISYKIITDEIFLPFYIDSQTGLLHCLESFDREKRSFYQFHILAYDHGYPISLNATIPIEIHINDINDNKPYVEYDKYEYSLEENYPLFKSFAHIYAYDNDLNTKLIYSIDKTDSFSINNNGDLYLIKSIDRELKDRYHFLVTVSDNYHQTSVNVYVKIVDINDCRPKWINPSKNQTILFINRDLIAIGSVVYHFQAIDYDDLANGNGLISYRIDESYDFLCLHKNGDLVLNSTVNIGRYLIKINAKDNGLLIQHSSLIFIELIIGDNYTDENLVYDRNTNINSLTMFKRIFLLISFFLSISFILIFIICIITIMIYRYRKQKYLCYIKYQKNKHENHFVESNSNTSKLSFEELHQKNLMKHSSSFTGTNIYVKTPQTTSDYCSNSSKQDEDVDEWINDKQQQQQQQNSTEISIENILYPDWLYRTEKKQVRFESKDDMNSYPYFNTTTIRQMRTGTMTMISNTNIHDTFL